MSPLAIFLFSVFLLFAIVANLPGWHLGESSFFKPGFQRNLVETRVKLTELLKEADETIASSRRKIAKERAAEQSDGERIATLEKRIAATVHARQGIVTAIGVLPAATADEGDGLRHKATGSSWFERKFQHARENPQLVLYKMKMSAYKYSWALIPLSVPFLWLLFPFSRRFGLYDHAVFVTYSLSFMSLLVIALAVLGAVGVPTAILATAAFLIPPVHAYKQLKRAYSLGRWSGLIRTLVLLSLIVWLIVPLFAILLVYFGVAD